MPKLTKTVVDAATRQPKRYILWDDELRGFGLLVLTSGVKSFIYDYRNRYGRQRRVTIGKYGDWTPAQARKAAEGYHFDRRQGRDPLGEKRAARAALTVGDVLDAYLASARFAEKADSTRLIDKGRIARHLRPLLGKRIVESLKREDIRRAFNAIRDGKTAAKIKTGERGLARVRGGEGTATESVVLLRAIFAWAVAEEMIATNPAVGVKTARRKIRDTVMRDPQDYERMFRTLDRMQVERRLRPAVADAIRVIALTGARRGEIAGLRWADVRLDQGLLIIAKHKTAKSTGEARVIGLPAAAQAIIAARAGEQAGPDDFVFPPASGAGPVNLSAPWRKIRVEAELPDGIGLHGLRHSLATHMAMEGAEAAEIMAAMGHRQMSTAQRYVHWAKDARAQLAEKSAAMISAALTGRPGADIRKIGGGR